MGAEAFQRPDPANARGNGLCGPRVGLPTTACMRLCANPPMVSDAYAPYYSILLESSGEGECEDSDLQRGVVHLTSGEFPWPVGSVLRLPCPRGY